MRCDEELRMTGSREIVNDLQKRQLALRGERRLGLVENVQALFESILDSYGPSVAFRLQRSNPTPDHGRSSSPLQSCVPAERQTRTRTFPGEVQSE